MRLRDLARITGVAESRISDYEHQRHEPSVAMLQRLLAATNHSLVPMWRSPIDEARNARVFADILSLADAIPPSPTGTRRAPPPKWADLVDRNRPA
jgi:transcriptional regulator with XRE-family HTH domain